jgi:hypothetical protein
MPSVRNGSQNAFDRGIESLPNVAGIVPHFLHRWPIRRLIRRKPAPYRINAEGKEPIKFWMERFQIQKAPAQEIPVKGLEVPQIKDDAMPFWNRPVVQCVASYQIEQLIGPGASFRETLQQFTANSMRAWCDQHE